MITSSFDPDARLPRLPVTRGLVWQPIEGWTYAHHAHLAFFAGRFVAIWSNGRRDEDAPGQRVLVSTSADGLAWSPAQVLAADGAMILTAAGLHHHDGQLVAYLGSYPDGIASCTLLAATSRDGVTWSAPRDLGVPVTPNHGPQPTRSGRLIIAGNSAFPWSDDPCGLTGWHMAGIHPLDRPGFHDDPGSFWRVREWRDWPVALCEAALWQTDDGILRMLLRSTGHGFRGRLWATASHDDGVTWSAPVETGFTDADTKFHLGRLPDGRFWHVGSPDPRQQHVRSSLVLSLSRDGLAFDRQFLVADEPWAMATPGRSKHGQYGYPHSLVHGDHWYVIISRQKEAIEVLRVPLGALA
ncbi:MAG: exo-alpha-sialidase [Planctomycetes bacterium]|nr:exo-alpha-sialidase [Planctomycetota bacterium]